MSIINEYNWLQLGPTCIPFGETDSPTRVIVSGRITSIAIHPKKLKLYMWVQLRAVFGKPLIMEETGNQYLMIAAH